MKKFGVSVNPLKTSPALGAAYALQGIKGAIALFHAAPGCTFLGKVLLTQHLREPVGLLGTDIKEMPTIMGGWDDLKKRITDVCEKFKPSLIGVIGTALAEVRGEDIRKIIEDCRLKIEDFKSSIVNSQSSIIYISCPDYMGGFGEGYAKAIEVVIENLAENGPVIPNQINILPCESLTAGDIEEIKDIISTFGLKPIVLSDLSLSMDGSKERFSNLPLDGTAIDEIKAMGRSSATFSIGEGMKKAGEILRDRFSIPLYPLSLPIGLEASDNFIRCLMEITGKKPSERIERWRRKFVDGMVDTHLLMAGKKAAVGLEGKLCLGISRFCLEMGMQVKGARGKPAPRIKCGAGSASMSLHDSSRDSKQGGQGTSDLEDLEDMAEGVDLIITNSHGKEISERLGIPLLRMGFPVFDRFGEPLKLRVGYRGSLNLLFEMANIFYENRFCNKG
ncbi:MAG: nitrogenase iron-molybdenum cofactor biosynthesis protein NifN [Nitrospinae bacterium]|nr:nitrogenase iron-molybdenum cofactor biosynthesis protein NifN [Nitrospinota bacterium]